MSKNVNAPGHLSSSESLPLSSIGIRNLKAWFDELVTQNQQFRLWEIADMYGLSSARIRNWQNCMNQRIQSDSVKALCRSTGMNRLELDIFLNSAKRKSSDINAVIQKMRLNQLEITH
jgi:hypothetical protein